MRRGFTRCESRKMFCKLIHRRPGISLTSSRFFVKRYISPTQRITHEIQLITWREKHHHDWAVLVLRLTLSWLTSRAFCWTKLSRLALSRLLLALKSFACEVVEPHNMLHTIGSGSVPVFLHLMSQRKPTEMIFPSRNEFQLSFNGELMNENWKLNVLITHPPFCYGFVMTWARFDRPAVAYRRRSLSPPIIHLSLW